MIEEVSTLLDMHKTWWVLVALITAAESFLPRSIHFLSQKSLGNGGRWLLFGEKKPDMDWDPKAAPKLDFEEDYYSVLEVDPEIKGKDLKKAYYKLVFKYHPDNKEGEEAKALCNKQMMVINNAYQTLKQDEKRSAYNRKRKYGGGMRGGGSSSTPKTSANSGSGFDYDQYGYGQRKATEQNEEKEEELQDARRVAGRHQGNGTHSCSPTMTNGVRTMMISTFQLVAA